MKPMNKAPKSEGDYKALVAREEDRLDKQAVRITLFHPFMSSLLLTMDRKPDMNVSTFATDGVSIYWNPVFVESLSDDEIRGLLVKTTMHCALGHLWRVKSDWDPAMAAMAMDYSINNFIDTYNNGLPDKTHALPIPGTRLTEMRGRKPKPGEFMSCLDHKFDDNSFEHIYSLISADPEHQQYAQQPDKGDKGNKGRGQGQPQPGGGGDPSDEDGEDGEGDGDGEGSPSENDGQYRSTSGIMQPGKDPRTNEEVTNADWQMNFQQAAQQAKAMGKLPADIERMILGALKPQVDWAAELSRFMEEAAKDDYSWQHPDRRYLGSGLYLPDLHSERMGSIAILVDTSGSVDDKILNRMASEIKFIGEKLIPEKIVVVYFDTRVQNVETFAPGERIVLHPRGGGGSDCRSAFKYINDNHDNVQVCAVLTDGFLVFPEREPRFPTLWLSYGAAPDAYPFGKVVEVTI